jgi:diguanylate cyclase (GGDEF)-like protein
MISAAIHENEPERLEALKEYDALDTPPEIAMDDVAMLAANICQTPMAAISLVDQDRQWFKARVGVNFTETRREVAFCAHVVAEAGFLTVPDTHLDRRFHDSPLVRGEPHVRFYAGVPLITPDGFPIGALCVMDREARSITNEQAEALQSLARQVMSQLELRRTRAKLVHASLHDALTGLPNRALVTDRIEQCIARARSRKDYRFAVMLLDLDRFKLINNSMDHGVGDKLLAGIASRLTHSLRQGDTVGRETQDSTVGRLGGDEFIVVLEDLRDFTNSARVATRLLLNISVPLEIEGQEVVVTSSIGIAMGTETASPAQLLRDAESAMYRAKDEGGNRFAIFDPSMHAEAEAHLQMENNLRKALDRGEFVLHYQPIVSLTDRSLKGFEALLRWRHDGELINTEDFIAVAENTGLIVPLGRWVIGEACRQLARWRTEFRELPQLSMSVNVSRRQFNDRELIPFLSQTLAATGIDPWSLQLELTESCVCDGDSAGDTIREFKNLGVRLAMDDFGKGYSSLSVLRNTPLDTVKIDREFVSGQGTSQATLSMLKAIVELAHNLKMRVVGEGIETLDQAAMLESVDCDDGQGFLFSTARDPAGAEQFVRESIAAKNAAA